MPFSKTPIMPRIVCSNSQLCVADEQVVHDVLGDRLAFRTNIQFGFIVIPDKSPVTIIEAFTMAFKAFPTARGIKVINCHNPHPFM